MDNSWKQNLKVSEDKEEKRILELQRKIKRGEITEEELSDEDREKIIMLYHKQNEALREKINQRKNEICKILKK